MSVSNRTYSRGLHESDHSSRFKLYSVQLAGVWLVAVPFSCSTSPPAWLDLFHHHRSVFWPETQRGNFEVQERSDGLLILLFDQGRSLIGGAPFPLPVLVLFPESGPHYPNIIRWVNICNCTNTYLPALEWVKQGGYLQNSQALIYITLHHSLAE